MIKSNSDISAIAHLEHLYTVSVKNQPDCMVGFNSFEEAEKLAEKHGLEIVSLKKRDGEREWHNEGPQFKPYDVMSFLMEKSNCICTMTPDQYEDQEDYIRGEDIKGRLEDFDSLEDMKSFIEQELQLYNELKYILEPDEFIFWTDDRLYRERMKRYDISMSYDVYSYQIALMPPYDYE